MTTQTQTSPTHRLAVIDVGSNTVRLLVVEGELKQYRILHQAQEITRLGEGLQPGKPFTPTAQERTLATLCSYAQHARSFNVEIIWALGTSAMRRASNGQEFIAKVEQTCGVKFEVVSGNDEARITMQGVGTVINLKEKQHVTIDIGGGSTEFILSNEQGEIVSSNSIEIGAVSLTERFIKNDPPTKSEMQQAFAFLRRELSPILNKFS